MKAAISVVAVYVLIGALIVIFFFVGGLISKQCTDIAGYQACWSTISRNVGQGSEDFDLCPTSNQSCIAEPFVMQHNAIIDGLVYSCNIAKTNNYVDPGLTQRIQQVWQESNGQVLTAQEICESAPLVKWRYG